MRFATRKNLNLVLIPILILAISGGLSAQEEPAVEAATETAAETPAVDETETPAAEEEAALSSHEVRSQFHRLLQQHPPELATILRLDPTLLSSDGFLAGYPELSRFVAEHPEVRRNPRFYLGEAARESHFFSEFLEMLVIFATFLLIAFALAWLVRTIIEQKRWSRLSRTQSEVHNKILDRFETSEELLEYIKTPAGARFLESAPIPLHEERAPQNPSLARVMWSIQIGVIVAAGALGLLLVSGRFDQETAQGMFAMGVIALCVGAGFVGSAAVSIFLSRRLGLWQLAPSAETTPSDPFEDSGLMR